MPQFSVYVEMTPFIIQVDADDEDDACAIAEKMVKSNDPDYNYEIFSNLYCEDAFED
jgi:hypothetical protein